MVVVDTGASFRGGVLVDDDDAADALPGGREPDHELLGKSLTASTVPA
jgi:hypothetical protein